MIDLHAWGGYPPPPVLFFPLFFEELEDLDPQVFELLAHVAPHVCFAYGHARDALPSLVVLEFVPARQPEAASAAQVDENEHIPRRFPTGPASADGTVPLGRGRELRTQDRLQSREERDDEVYDQARREGGFCLLNSVGANSRYDSYMSHFAAISVAG